MAENEEAKELINQARKLIRKKDKPAARSLLLKAVKIDPKNEQAWELLEKTANTDNERVKYLKKADEIRTANKALQEKIKTFKSRSSKSKIFWTKTNLIRGGLIFLVFTLIPFLWWFNYDVMPKLRTVKQMTGEWNVAVAGFTNLDTDLRRADISLISSVFSNRFSKEMETLGNNANLVVQIWGPEQVDQSISGNSVEKRAVEAEKLAAKLNIDLLIYGTIQKIDNGYSLLPEFYIRAENYYEADELIGQHRFGGPISILATRETLPSQLTLNLELTRRSKILALTARGLSLYLVHTYDQALQFFTQANQDDLWPSSDGRETIYLFQGNAAIHMQEFEQAKQDYSQAVLIEPQYGRGYVGLGNVNYSLALETASQNAFTPDHRLLEQALGYYKQALQAEIQPISAEVPSRTAFGMGQVYMAEWFTGQETHDLAVEQFNIVLKTYADGKNTRLQELASETHARLGVIYRQNGEVDIAMAELQKALDLSTLPARRGLYWASLSDLYDQKGEIEKAQDASQKSIEQYQLALTFTIPDEMKANYWAKIGERHEYLHEIDQAIQAYEQALKFYPADSTEYSIYQERLQALKP